MWAVKEAAILEVRHLVSMQQLSQVWWALALLLLAHTAQEASCAASQVRGTCFGKAGMTCFYCLGPAMQTSVLHMPTNIRGL